VGVKLTLLVRAYCDLCDEMREGLLALAAGTGTTVDLIDVDADPGLEARWGDKVPVLLAGSRELCYHRLDRAAVAAALAAGPT
jgi:hypothetical protein